MSIRTFAVASFTTEAVADTAAQANSKHMDIQGGGSGQYIKIIEVAVQGWEPSTSSPQKLILGRTSTVSGATIDALTTGQSDEPDDPNYSAVTTVAKTHVSTAGTAPQRAKKYLAMLGLNALGGVTRERFPVGKEPAVLGATADNGQVNLSGFTGTTAGLIGAHIKYEII